MLWGPMVTEAHLGMWLDAVSHPGDQEASTAVEEDPKQSPPCNVCHCQAEGWGDCRHRQGLSESHEALAYQLPVRLAGDPPGDARRHEAASAADGIALQGLHRKL